MIRSERICYPHYIQHLISLKGQSKDTLREIIDLAKEIKASPPKMFWDSLRAKSLVMLFQKTSTRTRLSFEIAMHELGGHAVFLESRTTQISLPSFQDELRAMMGMGDIFMFRALRTEDVELAASMNIVPVIDGCSEKYHPCQALGDIFTMAESKGSLEKIKKVVWLGIENNVSNTLMLACAKLGIDIFIVSPERDQKSLDQELLDMAEKTGRVHRTLDLQEAFRDADFVHTDTWMNMEFFGKDGKVLDEFQNEYGRRKKVFAPFQLSEELLQKYGSKARIMHCMPCHVGYEITRSAILSPRSLIFQQAKNRKHVQKAILLWILEK